MSRALQVEAKARQRQAPAFAPARTGSLQRCGAHTCPPDKCDDDRKKRSLLQRRSLGQAEPTTVPPIVEEVLRSPGQPLDPGTRALLEPRFGHDFSRVRVHTDARAAESAQAVNALAYTVGNEIVFSPGRFAPGTQAGFRLLTHELVHTIQQPLGIARQTDIIPAPPLETGGPALERALRFQPRLRQHVPRAPTISPPPVPEEAAPSPGPCPSSADAARDLRASDVASETEAEMQRDINLAQARATLGATRATPLMLQRADQAIRAEFSDVLPSGRAFLGPGAVTTRTPSQFAQLRTPDAASARTHIARAALEVRGDVLRALCITSPEDTNLQTIVAAPILQRRGIDFVRDYQAGRIGGQTTFTENQRQVTRHVDLPSESRSMGHIVAHEAMHFYVSDTYRRTADNDPREQQLMEGGAEFLARHVINQRLANRPEFAINTATYASEFSYVATYLMRGGLSTFKLAYFQGRVDLLGLTPAQPKLEVSQSRDPFEQEADRVAAVVLRMDEPLARRLE